MSGDGPALAGPDDVERLARERLDDPTWAWLAGGAGDEATLQANRRAWQSTTLLPRVLRPLQGSHSRIELLGRTLAHPLLLAPLAYQRVLHPLGELGSALAAATQGAGVVLSALSSVALEEVAQAVAGEPCRGPLWFQLHLGHDRGFDLALVQRAERAGFEALVLTVDAPVQGARDRERRAGFCLPEGVSAVHYAGAPARPSAKAGVPCAGLLEHAPTWDDVAWLRERTSLPLLLKGVLHPDDARQAAALGVAALIVSNHGGRQLDTVTSTAAALPRIADALDGALPLLVDGGIRRGTDVIKAIALGASAVLLGRMAACALAASGPQGVARMLRAMRDELEIALALMGCASLAELTADMLGPPQ